MDLVSSNSSLLNNSILKVKDGVETSVFDDGNEKKSYLIRLNNRHWKVSEVIYYILCSIDGKRTIAEIKENLNNEYCLQIEEEKLEQIIKMAFVQNGILEGTTAMTTSPKNKMMWGQFTLIKPSIIERFKVLSFLFNRLFLVTLSSAAVIWLVYIFSVNSNIQVINSIFRLDIKDIILCYIFVFFTGLAHELGHSIAAMSYGVSPGRIGFGVYFVMPVLFSDVTRIWKIKRHQRVIVDFGGMYLQCVFLLMSFLLNLFLMKSSLLNIAILISGFTIVGNLNPFIKFDGYWVLVDFLGITEIKSVMYKLWINLFYKLLRKPESPVNLSKLRKLVIYIYSIFTACFFVYFIKFLIESFILAVRNISTDIMLLYKLTPSGLNITFKGVVNYFSMRITTIIALYFFIHLIWRYIIKKLIIRFVKTGKSIQKEANCAAD